MADTPPRHADPRLAQALEFLAEAEKLSVPGDTTALGRAVAHAERAIDVLAAFVAATPAPEARNMLAASWMRRGIIHLLRGSEDALPEAVRCLDEAIRLRAELLAAHDHPALVHGQALAYLNRGDALARQGAGRLPEAVASIERALALLRTLPVGEAPPLLAQLVGALANRAALQEMQRTPESLTGAIEAHREILERVRGASCAAEPEFRLHRGAAATNAANLLLQAPPPLTDTGAAREAAEEAVQAVEGMEREHPLAGEIAIKARRAVCRAIGAGIDARGPGAAVSRDQLHAMTDAADEALALARHWDSRGAHGVRPIAIELFAFASNLYVRHQPHFLAEFVLDNLDPERSPDAFRACPEMHRIAVSLVEDALRHFERDRIITVDTRDVDRQIETLRDLRHARERLAALAPVAG